MNKKVLKRSKFILDKFPYILFGTIFVISIIIFLSVRSCLPLPFFSGVTKETEEETEYSLYISSPINNKTFSFFNHNETVPIEINAKEAESTGYTIKLLVNDSDIKSLTIPPYEYNWNPEGSGEYELVAQLIDDNGNILTESNTVNFTVQYEFESTEETTIDVSIEEKVNRILGQSNFIRNLNNTIPTGTPLLCYKCYTPPVIDGILQEWDKFYSFSSFYPTIMKESYNGPGDISGTFYSCWDDDNFYFAISVSDDLINQNYQGNELFKGDSIAIAFDTELVEDMYTTIYTSDDYLIYFSPGNFSSLSPESYIGYPSLFPTDIIVRSSKPTPNTYLLEASIPWDKFINYIPADENVLGFTVSIFDTDNFPTTGPTTELVMSSSKEFDKNDTSILGILMLLDTGDIQSEEDTEESSD